MERARTAPVPAMIGFQRARSSPYPTFMERFHDAYVAEACEWSRATGGPVEVVSVRSDPRP